MKLNDQSQRAYDDVFEELSITIAYLMALSEVAVGSDFLEHRKETLYYYLWVIHVLLSILRDKKDELEESFLYFRPSPIVR